MPAIENGFQLGFDDDETLGKARVALRKNLTDFDHQVTQHNGKPVLQLVLQPAKITEIREYSIK